MLGFGPISSAPIGAIPDTSPSYLRRYTDLPALLSMLDSKQITLLDPKSWDDLNDSYFMTLYKERKELKTVLALCFSQVPETYHHWHVFSKGPAGVCIVFDRVNLLNALNKQVGITASSVKYLTLKQAEEHSFLVQELPFLKRSGFKPEGEFRVIYGSEDAEQAYLNVPIELNCIRSISLSPWINVNLSKSTIKTIKAIQDCEKLRVSRSTLISNEQWKKFGRNAT
jgi:hypothetical protein